MYYLIKDDGSSIFEQPYPFDFCLHCLFNLVDNPDPMLQTCKLVHFEFVRQEIRPIRPWRISSQTRAGHR